MNTILNFDPEQIDKIHIKANKYIYGNAEMDGIVDIESNSGDASVLQLDDAIANYIYTPSTKISASDISNANQPGENPDYPDLRNVICWQPLLTADKKGQVEFKAIASDIKGKFRVKVSVLSPDGKVDTFFESLVVE
jgi:hypothetical protein